MKNMTEKESPAGWVVQVMPIPPPLPEVPRWTEEVVPPPSFSYFDTAIADPEKAVDAVKKHLAKADDDPNDVGVRTVRALSSAEIAVLDIRAGEVKPA
jgi:hypothetical protein